MSVSALAQQEALFKRILNSTDGELIQAVLESKTDGSVVDVVGRNHFTDKVPHIVTKDGTIYPYSRFSIRKFK